MTTILLISANPSGTRHLDLEEEAREIDRALRSTRFRDAFRIAHAPAARIPDFREALLRHRPTVVHFGGHGTRREGGPTQGDVATAVDRDLVPEDGGEDGPSLRGGGILVRDAVGGAVPFPVEPLGELFGILRGSVPVRCILLNACYTEAQAKTIAEHVECVVGTTRAIHDAAAIAFSRSFYLALGEGESIATAFALARNAIAEERLDAPATVQLWHREGVDPSSIRLAETRTEPVRFHVPFARNPQFVGRTDDLEKLHALLLEGGMVGVRPAALTGMGGIGKTQLAVEYAYRFRDEHAGGVYWVNAARGWPDELARLAEAVGIRVDDPSEAARRRRLTLSFAAFLRERPDALVVFDNVEDPLALLDPIDTIIPAKLGCRIMFTTRRRDPTLPFTSMDVRILPEDAALALLLSSQARRGALERGDVEELGAASAICETLGRLPLAIVLACAYLDRYPKVSLASYLKRLEKDGAITAMDAATVDRRLLATRHEAAVGATLRAQWEAIDNPAAREALQVAALLGEAAAVPRPRLSLLSGLSEVAPEGYPAALEVALQELHGLSLIEELTDEAIRLHPLVREFALRTIPSTEAFAEQCAARLAGGLADMARLHAEVARRGIDAVLDDLRAGLRICRSRPLPALAALLQPLDLEAHHLRRWNSAEQPAFFLQQFRNRCLEVGGVDILASAEAELKRCGWPYLRERAKVSRESGALLRTLEGHTKWVTGIAVATDGQTIVSGSYDATLIVWELESGRRIRVLNDPSNLAYVRDVAVTPDARLAIGAIGRTVTVFDVATGQIRYRLDGHADEVTSLTVASNGYVVISGAADGSVGVWDLATGQHVLHLTGHTAGVKSVALTPDDRFILSASIDSTVKVWDLSIGQEVRSLRGHNGPVSSVAVAADGWHAVSASEDYTLIVWDLCTASAVHQLSGHTDIANSVAIAPDDTHAISASDDGTINVWNLRTGKLIATLEGHGRAMGGSKTGWVTDVVITADGRFAVSASEDRTLKVWDMARVHHQSAHRGHTNMVKAVAATRDTRFAVSGAKDGSLLLWDIVGTSIVEELFAPDKHRRYAEIEASGLYAISSSETITIWHIPSRKIVKRLDDTYVSSFAASKAGTRIIIASDLNELRVLDIPDSAHIRTLHCRCTQVWCVAMDAAGARAISGGDEHVAHVWDLDTGEEIYALPHDGGGVRNVSMSVDGLLVATTTAWTLSLWDLSSGLRLWSADTSALFCGVSISTDGRFVVAVSDDRTLKVWNASTGIIIANLVTPVPMSCCAITPDNNTIIAGDISGAVHFIEWAGFTSSSTQR